VKSERLWAGGGEVGRGGKEEREKGLFVGKKFPNDHCILRSIRIAK